MQLYTFCSHKNTQTSWGQTAPWNYPLLSLIYYRGWESVSTPSLCSHGGFAGSRSRNFAHLYQSSALQNWTFSELKAGANLHTQIFNWKFPLLRLLFAALLQHWCLEVGTKLTPLGYSVALHLCLLEHLTMERALLLPPWAGQIRLGEVGSCPWWGQEQESLALALSPVWTPFPFPLTSTKPWDRVILSYLLSYCFPGSRGLQSSAGRAGGDVSQLRQYKRLQSSGNTNSILHRVAWKGAVLCFTLNLGLQHFLLFRIKMRVHKTQQKNSDSSSWQIKKNVVWLRHFVSILAF